MTKKFEVGSCYECEKPIMSDDKRVDDYSTGTFLRFHYACFFKWRRNGKH